MEIETGGNWSQIIASRPKGLEAAALIVQKNQSRKVLTFVNINTHFEGSALIIVERFLDVLRQGENFEI